MTITQDLTKPLLDARLTGTLTHNSRVINEQAVRELIAQNPYWSLGSTALAKLALDYDQALKLLIASFGISAEEFTKDETSFINPVQTGKQLLAARTTLQRVAKAGGTIMLATGHPGSMLELYRCWGEEAMAVGGKIWTTPGRVAAPHGRWLDQVGGVIALSDEGSLQHTHADEGLRAIMASVKPDLVVADHGFAAAAIDCDIPTVAFYDTDDPAIPILAANREDVIAIPMNDNQTNYLTATAVRQYLAAVHVD